MNQKQRILIAAVILVILGGGVLGLETLRRERMAEADLEPGSIPIYVGGKMQAAFTPADLEDLEHVSFKDAEEGKTQKGWLLRDVLLLHLSDANLSPDTRITIISTSREKSADLTWSEVANVDNMVMFDLSGRGTLKLVSKLDKLDTRDEWVQDTDRIEVEAP